LASFLEDNEPGMYVDEPFNKSSREKTKGVSGWAARRNVPSKNNGKNVRITRTERCFMTTNRPPPNESF